MTLHTTIDDLSRSMDECDRNLAVGLALESIADSYDFESFESVDFKALGLLIDNVVSSRGLSLEDISTEDSVTPASDAATGDEPSKMDKVKSTIKATAEKFIEKAKEVAKDIPGYLAKLEEVLMNSTKALKDSIITIENKLQNGTFDSKKISGRFGIFEKTNPSQTIAIINAGATALSTNIEVIFNDYLKKAKGETSNTEITLVLKDHTGAEFKYDGTTKFFKPNMSFEKKEMTSLSKTDIETTCRELTKLIATLDGISDKTKKMGNTNFDSLVSNVRSGDANVKGSVKEVMSIASFNRNVIGGYIKYAIKIAQASLDACNKSINTKEDVKDE